MESKTSPSNFSQVDTQKADASVRGQEWTDGELLAQKDQEV